MKIGFVVADSGAGSVAFSSARSGINARIGLANQNGGIGGREIVYQWRDDGGSPSQDASATADLVNRESVFGLIAVTSAFSDSMPPLDAQGVPVVGLAAEPAWAEHQNMFSNNYGPSPETIGRYLLSSGGTKVAVITSGNSSFNATAVPRFEAALRSVGVDTVGTIPYSRGGEAPARIVQQIAERGANALVGFTEPSDFADIVGATQNARISMAASVSLSGYDQELLKTSGPALAGVSFPVYFRPFEAGGAAIDSYRNAMTRYAPETVHPEQQFAMFAYIYADMFLRGLQLAGPCPTREGFIKALRGVTSYDSGGLIEPVNLSTNRGQPSSCNAFVQIDPAGTAFQVTHLRVCADGSGS